MKTASSPTACRVYVSSTESREIHAFQLDPETGRMTLIEAIGVPGSGAPTRGNIPLTRSRDNKVLYAQVRIDPFPLSAFTIDPGSGRLTLLDSCLMPAPIAYLSTTLNGKFMLGASYDGALLTVNAIEPDGRLARPCRQTIPTSPKAHCIIEAPFGGLVYATTVDGDAILAYRLDPVSGRLEPTRSSVTYTQPGSGPRHLVFHPTLDRLYCINEHSGTLTSYSVDRASGALQALQDESLMPPDFSGNALAADIHLTPNAAFLYASIRKTNSIKVFKVDPLTGMISNTGAFTVDANPRGFAIEPNGRFLLCAGQETKRVTVYAIRSDTGALDPIAHYAVGKRPSWIEISPVPEGV
ncbi:lactonase family protein [Pollutimonas sp. M17]|uniref:lactonase family protein n=1 Tax=Pollutimonas sp. M17 TaxID=2962065 RepID=UPI0021F44AFD|nr:lactonase family protein [Pollutimonas sp. M17]UYO93561.1 lactonase family protein [Pollutimonas sp. M17]